MMKIHNTLTRSVDEFTPLNPNEISIYSCGPTVYDHIHIGNLRAFIIADTLRRILSLKGTPVKHVINITDIDDKTISRSQADFPDLDPMTSLDKLTSKYTDIFMRDMEIIGNDLSVVQFAKATDYIEQIESLIQVLLKEGLAYIADDGIYFSIKAYLQKGKKYGQLSNVTASSTSEERISNDDYDKESAHDFVLWKSQKPGEPAWKCRTEESEITGRPGWHIECSTMSTSLLGQPFDIHTGGVDLIFPHHENEITQSTATTSGPYARYFVHNEHLLVEGRKMSKSLNNFYTLRNLEDKGFSPMVFRMMMLQSHYRTQANFSWTDLESARNRLKQYYLMADLRWQAKFNPDLGTNTIQFFERIKTDILQALEDDMDTPKALSLLSEAETEVTSHNGLFADEAGLTEYHKLLDCIDKTLGLRLLERKNISKEQHQKIKLREEARANKDWVKSDQLRDELLKENIEILDTATGTVWTRL